MRFLGPLILFAAIIAAGIGRPGELDTRRTADRTPASVTPPSAVKTSEVEAPEAARTPASVRNDLLWPANGERWIYRFQRKAQAEFGGKPWLKLSIGGRAAIESVDSANGSHHGDNRFYLLTVEVDRLEMQGETRNETRSFPSVRIEIDAAGKVRELRFATTRVGGGVVTEEESDLVRDLASQWLFFESRSRMGVAQIEWSGADLRGNTPGKRTIQKHITSYAGRPEVSKLDSNHEWVAGESADLKVDRIEGTENFTLASGSAGDFVQSTSYRWLWTSTEKSSLPELALGEAFTLEESTRVGTAPENKPDAARVAREWPGLKGLAPHVRLKLFRDAKRALDAGSSELVSLILRDLRGKSANSIEWRTGVGALASTSNPEAAKALLALFRESGRTAEEKLSILSGVAAGEGAPAPEWKQTFEAALERTPANVPAQAVPTTAKEVAAFDPGRDYDPEAAVREASLYALGSSIRKETDATRRTELESVLWREAKDARTEGAQVAVLEAIGNSGSTSYTSYIQDQYASGGPKIRAKAVAAARFLASDAAKPIIDRAKGDPAPTVRKAAEWSAKFQDTSQPQE